MSEITMKVGSTIRLTSFANKPADGSDPKGFSASPEHIPEEDRKVFVCLLLGIEPQLLEDPSSNHDEELIEKALNSLGYYKQQKDPWPGLGQGHRH